MRIKKVAVLGAGTMGSQIAAHFANASTPSLLFDLPGLATKAVEKLKKVEPTPLFNPENSQLIEPHDYGPDFSLLKTADWIIEAIIEDVDAKRALLQSILPHLNTEAIVTSNTSGLPLTIIAEGMPQHFRRRWFGTHFFNPPRYLKLLELIPTKDSDQTLIKNVASFADRNLGKGTIFAKDTPNFIANRLATFGALHTLKIMQEDGYTIEEVDAITGPVVGRPKSATFRLMDLVGIDVLAYVANNLYRNALKDEQREIFTLPEFIQLMLQRKWLGNKSGQGFYKKVGSEILALDLKQMEYRPLTKPSIPSIELVRSIPDPIARVGQLIQSKDHAGKFVWNTLSALLVYAANRVPEISDDIVNIDRSMKWGFGWTHGPFELWDGLGVQSLADRIRAEGGILPEWVEALLNCPNPSFYRLKDTANQYWDISSRTFEPVMDPPGMLFLERWKRTHGILKKNAGASLIDIDDGVLCLEFHSKMNAIGGDTIQMAKAAIELLDKEYEGLIIANQGENFSAGANLMLLLLEAQEGNWDELNLAIRAFQKMTMSFRYSAKPVVAAPFGLALGGGCEICLGADGIHAAAEVYIGLAETGAGLVPAGGGTKEMLMRQMRLVHERGDPLPHLKKAFETIALAKISRSVTEAKKLGYLRDSDTFSMNTDRVVADAKNVVLRLSQGYRPPQPARNIIMTGRAGFSYLQMGIHLMKEAGYISEYDAKIGQKVAHILTGGDFTEPTYVDEQYVLDMEREAFLSLLGERKTQERIQHLLKTGKPLRN